MSTRYQFEVGVCEREILIQTGMHPNSYVRLNQIQIQPLRIQCVLIVFDEGYEWMSCLVNRNSKGWKNCFLTLSQISIFPLHRLRRKINRQLTGNNQINTPYHMDNTIDTLTTSPLDKKQAEIEILQQKIATSVGSMHKLQELGRTKNDVQAQIAQTIESNVIPPPLQSSGSVLIDTNILQAGTVFKCQSQIEEAEQGIKELKKTYEGLIRQLRMIKISQEDALCQKISLQKQLQNKGQQIERLNLEHDAIRKSGELVCAQNQRLKEQVQLLEKQSANPRQRTEPIKKEIEASAKETWSIERKTAEMKNEAARVSEFIERYEKQNNQLDREIEQLEQKNIGIQKQCEKRSRSIKKHMMREAELEKKKANLAAQLDSKTSELREVKKVGPVLGERIRQKKQKILQVESQVQSVNRQSNYILGINYKVVYTNTALKKDLEKVQKHLAMVKRTHQRLVDAVKKFRDDDEALENRIKKRRFSTTEMLRKYDSENKAEGSRVTRASDTCSSKFCP